MRSKGKVATGCLARQWAIVLLAGAWCGWSRALDRARTSAGLKATDFKIVGDDGKPYTRSEGMGFGGKRMEY